MDRWIKQLAKLSHFAAQFILFVMAMFITLDVLSRWLWNRPITGTVDFTELGLSMVIFLSIAYTHVKEEHITIDFFVERFSTRTQFILDGFIHLIIAVLLVLVAWSTGRYAVRLYHANTVTGDLAISLYPIAWLAVMGLSLFAWAALLHAIRYMQKGANTNDS
ncbi:TRAP transporter small permease [Virgibacillus pantothenticus]|uniref:TRAP transporter small permease n=1 Tax=Virgibacillus pantothenticus TaxID=1473 RepID=UPI0009856D9E|nr:TRAP transporter small permease [Virgibacillus pantothenticus]GIP62386.1 hypothetical protein J32TS6_09410 [Virgibacillus pantothenticus]